MDRRKERRSVDGTINSTNKPFYPLPVKTVFDFFFINNLVQDIQGPKM